MEIFTDESFVITENDSDFIGYSNCCQNECLYKYQDMIPGCGSDSNFYFNKEDFCNQFCKNRNLSLTKCYEGSCGQN